MRTLAAVALGAVATALLFVIWRALDALLLLFAGLLLSLFLSTLADWLRARTGVPRPIALVLVMLTATAMLVGVFWASGPALADQVGELRARLPGAIDRVKAGVERAAGGSALIDGVPDPAEMLGDREAVLSRATGVVSATLGVFGNLFIILLAGIFIAAEPGTYLNGAVRLVVPARRARVREALVEAGSALRRWLLAKVVRMIFIGLVTWIALSLLEVPVAPLLALIAGLLSFVPNFGPIAAAVPAILLALLQGVDTAVWVTALYVGIQVVEGSVLDPILTKTMVAMPPALTFAAQVVLAVLVGPIGVAVATPLATGIVVLVRRLYVEDALGDRREEGRA